MAGAPSIHGDKHATMKLPVISARWVNDCSIITLMKDYYSWEVLTNPTKFSRHAKIGTGKNSPYAKVRERGGGREGGRDGGKEREGEGERERGRERGEGRNVSTYCVNEINQELNCLAYIVHTHTHILCMHYTSLLLGIQ